MKLRRSQERHDLIVQRLPRQAADAWGCTAEQIQQTVPNRIRAHSLE
jgi:hypothetical protein